jgi:hypothetical protein
MWSWLRLTFSTLAPCHLMTWLHIRWLSLCSHCPRAVVWYIWLCPQAGQKDGPVNQNGHWRTPNSLRDSNVNPKLKTTEEQGVNPCSLARNTIEG